MGLADEVDVNVSGFLNQLEHLILVLIAQVIFQFWVGVEVVFDGALVLPINHHDIFNPGLTGFFNDELNGWLVDDW